MTLVSAMALELTASRKAATENAAAAASDPKPRLAERPADSGAHRRAWHRRRGGEAAATRAIKIRVARSPPTTRLRAPRPFPYSTTQRRRAARSGWADAEGCLVGAAAGGRRWVAGGGGLAARSAPSSGSQRLDSGPLFPHGPDLRPIVRVLDGPPLVQTGAGRPGPGRAEDRGHCPHLASFS